MLLLSIEGITDHPLSGWFDEAPSEGGDVVGKAPKGAHFNVWSRLQLFLFRLTLIPNVFSYRVFIQADCAYAVLCGPET